MKKDDIVGGVFLGIVILAFGLFFFFAPSAPELSYGPVEIPGSSITATASDDGGIVVVAALVKPGFVTIHKSLGGAPGPIIGSSDVIAVGEQMSVTVMPSEPMEAGSTYVALLHVDNGDGTFVINDDMPVTSNGISVRSDFIAQ